MENSEEKVDSRIETIIVLWIVFAVYFIISGIVNIDRNVKINNIEDSIEYTKIIYDSGVIRDRKKINNPNEFNENCIINETSSIYMYNENILVPVAMKFYEVTGIQLYYAYLDLDNAQNIECNSDAEKWAKARINELIDDDYGIVLYETTYLTYGRYTSYGVDKTLSYGSKVSDIFDSSARELALDIIDNTNNYYKYYKEGTSAEALIPLEIARQLFPSEFPERIDNFDKFRGTKTIVNIDRAEEAINSYKCKNILFRVSWAVLFVVLFITNKIIIKRTKLDSLTYEHKMIEERRIEELMSKYKG